MRLDREAARKVEFLKQQSEATTSGVVRAAIDLYYRRARKGRRAGEVVRSIGFLGGAVGEPELSDEAKSGLARGFGAKHGLG